MMEVKAEYVGPVLQRISEKKNWAVEFENKIKEIGNTKDANSARKSGNPFKQSRSQGNLIAQKLGRRVRHKLKDSTFSCKRTIDNLAYPSEMLVWQPFWGTKLICDICKSPSMTDCIACRTCNTVAHRLCVASFYAYQKKLLMQSGDYNVE